MDVDGTLTDGRIYMGPEGEAMKAFDIKDGYAIASFLPKMQIIPVILTGRSSKIVERRAEELGVSELHQNVGNKLEKLKEIISKYNITADEAAYIGDDLNDTACMSYVGFSGCPGDAADEGNTDSKGFEIYEDNGDDDYTNDTLITYQIEEIRSISV